jgi:hypothetical protein
VILHMTLVDRAVKSIWQFRLLAVVGLVTATVSIGSADSIMISKDEIPDVRVYAQLDGSSIDVYFNNSMCRFTPTQIDTLRDRIGTYLRWHAKVSKETGARIEKPIGHACGENAAAALGIGAGSGTSPRVWGKPVGVADADRRERYIPTRVGKTLISCGMLGGYAVHPHACGENYGKLYT